MVLSLFAGFEDRFANGAMEVLLDGSYLFEEGGGGGPENIGLEYHTRLYTWRCPFGYLTR